MASRAIWTGSLSFGLVNVPIGLFTATDDKAIHFNQFQAGTTDRIRYKRVNERTGEEVANEDIVKGYDLGGGEYVILTPDDIASVSPEKSKTIAVSAFVDLDEVDPIYFDKPYYLAPHEKTKTKGGEHAYSVLREAMARSGKAAIATFVLREKEYVVAIRPKGDAMVLQTLLRADEVRELPEVQAKDVSDAELDMAQMLVESLAGTFDPADYPNEYRDKLLALIEAKRTGAVIPVEVEAAPKEAVGDLLAALSASVAAARKEPVL